MDVLQKSSKDNKPEQDIKAPPVNHKQAEIVPLKENTGMYKYSATSATSLGWSTLEPDWDCDLGLRKLDDMLVSKDLRLKVMWK